MVFGEIGMNDELGNLPIERGVTHIVVSAARTHSEGN